MASAIRSLYNFINKKNTVQMIYLVLDDPGYNMTDGEPTRLASLVKKFRLYFFMPSDFAVNFRHGKATFLGYFMAP